MIATKDSESTAEGGGNETSALDIEISLEDPDIDYYHKSGDIILSPMGATNYIDSNAFWMIESKSIVIGGSIAWKSEKYRFKNLNTGKYLLIIQNEDDCILTVTKDNSDEGTLFTINEMYNAVNKLSNAKALQISSNNYFLTRGEALQKFQMAVTTCTDKSQAINLIIRPYTSDIPKGESSLVEYPFDGYIPL